MPLIDRGTAPHPAGVQRGIVLGPVELTARTPCKPCQSLFVAPCSHVWHYKCIRPILNGPTWPHFLCPNCRAVSDLDVEIEESVQEWEDELPGFHTRLAQSTRQDEDALSRSGTVNPMRSNTAPSAAGHLTNGDSSQHVSNGHRPPEGRSGETELTRMQSLSLSDDSAAADQTSPRDRSSQIHAAQTANPSSVVGNGAPPRQPGRLVDERTGSPKDIPSPPLAALAHEGPLTPRNDIGPFVLDGSGSRRSGRSIVASLQQSTPPSSRIEQTVPGSVD